MEALTNLSPMEWLAIEIAGAAIVLAIVFRWSGVIRYIPNDRLGILEKLWSFRGSVKNGFIALIGIGLTNLFGLTAEGLVAGTQEMARLQTIQTDYAGNARPPSSRRCSSARYNSKRPSSDWL